MIRVRRKGIAIVHTSKGILMVAGRRKLFSLPGGGANKGESRKMAAIRELKEETGLKTKNVKYLFSYFGNKWLTYSGKLVKNHTKVFLITTEGIARPEHEIKHIAFWKSGSKLRISKGTERVIHKYLEVRKG